METRLKASFTPSTIVLLAALTALGAPIARAGGANRVGLNGAACSFPDVASAIAVAQDGDEVFIQVGYYVEQPGLVERSLVFTSATEDCTADADGMVILDGVGLDGRLFRFDGAGDAINIVTFDQFNLTQSNTNLSGGLFSVESADVTFRNSVFSTGQSGVNGGCAAVDGGALTIEDSRFTNCTAGVDGGAIYVQEGSLLVTGSQIDTNNVLSWTGDGGAIAGLLAQITIAETVIEDNDSELRGGGISLEGDGSTLEISGGSISGNRVVYSASAANLLGKLGIPRKGVASDGPRGGAIFIEGDVTFSLSGTTVQNNSTAAGSGGDRSAISLYDGVQATVQDCNISSNEESSNGALRAAGEATLLSVTNCDFNNNARAVAVTDGSLVLANSRFKDNQSNIGAAVSILTAEATIQTSEFVDNVATTSGGAIHVAGGQIGNASEVEITQSLFESNSAAEWGGAIYVRNSTVLVGGQSSEISSNITLADNSFISNGANERGGAIHARGYVSLSIQLDAFSGNFISAGDTGDGGGAIFMDSSSQLSLVDVDFTGNTGGALGGAIALRDESTLSVVGGEFDTNSAGTGGAIYIIDGLADLVSATFSNNEASGLFGNGGALYLRSNVFRLVDLSVHDNMARRGGGLFMFGASGAIQNSRLTDNFATQDGGAALILGSTVSMQSLYFGALACEPLALAANSYCSEVRGNLAATQGGAFALQSTTTTDSVLTIQGTTLVGNQADEFGAAIFIGDGTSESRNTVTLLDSLLIQNGVDEAPVAAVELEERADLTIRGSTLADNAGQAVRAVGPDSDVDVSNAILWDNGAPSLIDLHGVELVVNCAISEQEQEGSGDLGEAINPAFVEDPARGVYHLDSSLSPVIDLCASGTTNDLDGNARPAGEGWDPGAFEADAIPRPDLIFSDGFE